METKTKNNLKKVPKLTKKQVFFVNEIVLGTPQTLAALKAYNIQGKDKIGIAGSIAVENMQKPAIKTAIEVQAITLKAALVEQGVTPTKIAQKVSQLLEAETPIYKNNNATKQVELVGHSPDYGAIDKGLKHAKDIYGVLDQDKPVMLNTTYNFLFNEQAREEIKAIEAKIKEKLINVRPNQEINKAE